MAEFNTIKVKQIDQEDLSNFVSSYVGTGSTAFIIDYLATGGSFGNSLVYASNISQNISGKKTFLTSPAVPYTGGTGDATSRRYIDSLFSIVDSGLSALSSNTYVYRTGDQNIDGNKLFIGDYVGVSYLTRTGSDESAYGINIAESILVDGLGESVFNWESRTASQEWTFNEPPIIDGGYPVISVGNQSIAGVKTFSDGIRVPEASNTGDAVPYAQFKNDLESTGKQLSDLITLSASSIDTSGFAGVLSINGISGNIFTQGRGSVTVKQNGNILSISGDYGTQDTSLFASQEFSLSPTGYDKYRVDFENAFDNVPLVFAQLSSNTGIVYGYQVSGVDTSGYSLVLSSELAHTGFKVSSLAIDKTGLAIGLKGEQGLIGPSLTPAGEWQDEYTYGYLDFITINGASWVCISGHTSSEDYHPNGISGDAYWNILASGTGPRGYDGGSVFAWGGEWDSATAYISGNAVFYNGCSYATHESTTNEPPTGDPWFVVAQRGDSGLSFRYLGDYSTSTNYVGGDVVRFNGGSYVLPDGISASGNKYNPVSVYSEWDAFQDRVVQYNGNYLADKVYFKNDLAYTRSGYGADESIQYIWTADYPVLSFHPNNYYNSFVDCDLATGYNLFELTVSNKDTYNTRYGSGSPTDINLNLRSRNQYGSGFDDLTLIRGKAYYFDNENTFLSFIIATQESGGNYEYQFVDNVKTGARLLVGESNYEEMAYDFALSSGTMRFEPDNDTPDELFLCSPISGYMGWKLRIVDENPWQVFTSGVRGVTGASGESIKGDAGLAFVWRGTWDVDSGYVSGDCAFYDGSTYGTLSSAFGTAPPNSPWFLLASKGDAGQDAAGLAFTWKGDWDIAEEYEPFESVYYNGSSYATTGNPSIGTVPTNLTYWFPVAKSGSVGPKGEVGTGIGFNWMGSYSPVTNYVSGNAVYFQGSSYGSTATVSGIDPTGSASWTLLAAGSNAIFAWRNAWSANTYYHSGDAVSYDGSSYACFSTNYNTLPTIGSVWGLIAAKGSAGTRGLQGGIGPRGTGGLAFEWRGDWDSSFSYSPYDAVFYEGGSYGTILEITGVVEKTVNPVNSEKWFDLAKKGEAGLAFNWKGTWAPSTLYHPYDSVYHSGRSYATLSYAAVDVKPTSAPWFVVAGMGGEEFCLSSYMGTGFPQTGVKVAENFATKNGHITGFVWAMTQASAGSYGVSGVVYKQTMAGTRTDLFPFNIKTPLSYWSGSADHSFSLMDRLGFDLSGNSTDAADITNLSIGLRGYYSYNS